MIHLGNNALSNSFDITKIYSDQSLDDIIDFKTRYCELIIIIICLFTRYNLYII